MTMEIYDTRASGARAAGSMAWRRLTHGGQKLCGDGAAQPYCIIANTVAVCTQAPEGRGPKPEEEFMAAFNTFGHIALKVRDLDQSIAFYEKLGFPEFLRLNNDDGKAWIAYLRFDDHT
jgi:hypothetical protein